jgi:hypothetical protein
MRVKDKLILGLMVLLLSSFVTREARAEFVGELKFAAGGCPDANEYRLEHDFGYVDTKKTGWQAKMGDCTDGASIPSWAVPIVGGAFDMQFIKAAVIHDHYCRRRVRPWRQTHWVFYDALLASRVPKAKSKLMYFAVYLAGDKWTKLDAPDPCKIGDICIASKPPSVLPEGISRETGEDGKVFAVRPSSFERPGLSGDLKQAEALIEQRGDEVPLDELEALADKLRPGDFFYSHGDVVIFQMKPQFEQ